MLSKLLSSRVRAEIFRLLFGISVDELHLREIERRTKLNVSTIRQELQKLSKLDLVISKRDGNRLYYRANLHHPIYPDIRNIVLKTVGLIDILKANLTGDDIQFAFVFGSIARGDAEAESDIDLMVIGTLSLRKLIERLDGIANQIAREINPHVMTAGKYRQRLNINRDPFLLRVHNAPKLFIIGNKHELAGLDR